MDLSEWRGARVVDCEPAADDMVTLRIEPDRAYPHEAGQHYEVRLPNGGLSRKFSIVSSPSSLPLVEFGIQVLPTGQVSPRLAQLRSGDRLDIRGPLGRAFVWIPGKDENLLLLGAGAGITPLLSMWSRFDESAAGGTCRFIVSAKSTGRVYQYRRLRDRFELRLTHHDPRLSRADVESVLTRMPRSNLSVRICGPSGFVTTMVDALTALGVEEDFIRSEGFA